MGEKRPRKCARFGENGRKMGKMAPAALDLAASPELLHVALDRPPLRVAHDEAAGEALQRDHT